MGPDVVARVAAGVPLGNTPHPEANKRLKRNHEMRYHRALLYISMTYRVFSVHFSVQRLTINRFCLCAFDQSRATVDLFIA